MKDIVLPDNDYIVFHNVLELARELVSFWLPGGSRVPQCVRLWKQQNEQLTELQ